MRTTLPAPSKKSKVIFALLEVFAWLSISLFITAHVYGLKTQCENVAVYVKC